MIIKKKTALVFLILSGLILNVFSPRLFMGFNYLFGSIPVLIILRFYGIWWGTLAGIIAGSWTYVLFGHPYAMVWLTAEPIFIGLALRYTSIRNLVLLNTLYWPLVGIPLLWIFFKFVMGLPFVGTLPAALMFWLIGIANSLAATIIIQITPLGQSVERKDEYRIVTMRQAVFSMMMSLVVFPAIIIMVLNGRAIMARNEHNIINKVHDVAKRYNQSIDLILKPPLLIWSNTGLDHIPNQKEKMNIEYVKKYLSELEKDESNNWITLLDSQNNILFTSTPRFLNQSVYTRDKLNQTRSVQKNIEHVLPPMPKYITLWRRVQKSWYKYESPVRKDMGWKWVIEIPFAPFQISLLEQQTISLQAVLFLCLAALFASLLISYRFNSSILELADITTGLAERVEKDKTIVWPKSRLGEVKTLADNFRHVANTLKLKFRQLRQSNESLEEKVTERTLALHTAKEQAERVYRLMPSALFTVDQDRRIIIWNKKAEQITGYSASEVVGQKCTIFSAEPCIRGCRLDSKEQIPAEGIECTIICKDQREITVSKNIDNLIDGTGNIIGGIESFEDITGKLKLEEQLRQAQKMESIGTLAGGIAHDFNNMLGVILGHTELALLQADENHELHDDLKEIQNAAKRSADITKQLLAFARKQTISPRQLDLNNTVESMLNMLHRLIGEDIELIWQPASDLWPVKMDPSQIDQILANLCVNARDAISGVGKLSIKTGRCTLDQEYCSEHPDFIPGDFVLLAVSDNGCGMDKDTLDNLFEPFFTTKEVGKGTGLGLATIYGIVKQNKGFINVNSEPGQGATFKIYLPRLVADEDTDKAVPEKKAAAGGSETILLVEDEPSILRMTRMMLERKGYTVLTATIPAEAVGKAKNHSDSIDLLMTDVIMPEMNGRDLAEKITTLYPGVSLLFMSGYTADIIAKQGMLDDGVAFIQKPFSMADMTEKVREVLDMAPDKNQG